MIIQLSDLQKMHLFEQFQHGPTERYALTAMVMVMVIIGEQGLMTTPSLAAKHVRYYYPRYSNQALDCFAINKFNLSPRLIHTTIGQ
jgi:hypothetical protein